VIFIDQIVKISLYMTQDMFDLCTAKFVALS